MTEAEEPTGLVQEFIQTIKDGAARLTTYRDACTKFTDDTRQHAGELKALIDRLEDCIRQIEALQEEYENFWLQLTKIQQNILILIKKAKQDAHKQGEEECDKKITQIRNEFTLMLNLIKSLKLNTKTGMKGQLDRLKAVIERLCGEGDSLVKKMIGNKDKMGAKVGDMQRVLAQYGDPETPRSKRRQQATSRGATAARRHQGSRGTQQGGPGAGAYGQASRVPVTKEQPRWRGGCRRTRKVRGGYRYGTALASISKSKRRTRRKSLSTKRSRSRSSRSKSRSRRKQSKRTRSRK